MDSASDAGGGLSPAIESPEDPRFVEAARESAELDRQRQAIRLEVARLAEGVVRASSEIHLGITGNDDHNVIAGLRRLLSIGQLAKPLADRLEQTLPQPSRLFVP